jgi:hypothetical protein
VTTPTSVTAGIEQLARQGATPGELLGMLPVSDLFAAINVLDEDIEWLDSRGPAWEAKGDKLKAVRLVLAAEIDSRP